MLGMLESFLPKKHTERGIAWRTVQHRIYYYSGASRSHKDGSAGLAFGCFQPRDHSHSIQTEFLLNALHTSEEGLDITILVTLSNFLLLILFSCQISLLPCNQGVTRLDSWFLDFEGGWKNSLLVWGTKIADSPKVLRGHEVAVWVRRGEYRLGSWGDQHQGSLVAPVRVDSRQLHILSWSLVVLLRRRAGNKRRGLWRLSTDG